ncbi:MAG: phosphohydrolase, partial [Xanthobacteraceae bacterium]
MPEARAWVRLLSGKRLDLLNPTPFDWEDEDLALGLARTYR